ncbi:MAG: hypothetical protein K8R76_12925 [Candidatus Aegiribacteria sp.]|nr:hypothetical protein [Candidatus Aegiribacteria sp.]
MRSKSLSITVLRCPDCGNDLDGLSTDIIFFCTECGRCLVSGDKLAPVEIEFTRYDDSGTILLPFWKVDATIDILRRITRSESRATPIIGSREFHGGNPDLVETYSVTGRNLIIFPAFSTSLVLSTGVKLNEEEFSQEPLQHGKYQPMIGGSIDPEDVSKLASGVAVGIEVWKSDYLAFIDLNIEVHSVKVLAIGCTQSESAFRINGTDINIPFTAVKDADDILKRSGYNT